MRPIRKSGRPSPECPDDEEGRIGRPTSECAAKWDSGLNGEIAVHYVASATYPLIELFSALAPVLPTPTSSTVDSYTFVESARRVSILARQPPRWPSRSLMHSTIATRNILSAIHSAAESWAGSRSDFE